MNKLIRKIIGFGLRSLFTGLAVAGLIALAKHVTLNDIKDITSGAILI